MALTGSVNRLQLAPVPPTAGEVLDRGALAALSQRKLNALATPLAYIDRTRRFRFANTAFLEWIGKRSGEVIAREIGDVLGRDHQQFFGAYADAALAGEVTGFEWQVAIAGRPATWMRVDYFPDRNQQGNVRGFLATWSDVDQLKGLEVEAGEREHRLRLVTDSIGLPILHFDRQLRVRFANRPYSEWIGIAPDDLLGHGLAEFLPGEALLEMKGYIERALAGATVSCERRERRAAGDLRWVRITLFPDREVSGRVCGAFAVWSDIEDDVRVREMLKSQQQQLRLFADNIPGPIAYLDQSLHYSFVNQAFANWVCKPQDEIYGRTPFEVMAADVAAFLRPILKRAQGGEHVEYERIGQNANGQRRWMHGRIAPDLDSTGKVRGLYCTEYDIHDLKQTERELAARETQLRLFTDNIPEPVVYLDSERRCTCANDAFLELYGLHRDEVIGKRPEEIQGVVASQSLIPGPGASRRAEAQTYERAVVDALGRKRWIRARCVPDLDFDGSVKGQYIVGHDITDLKAAQDSLASRESQLRAIMDGVPAPVAYIGRDERCLYVNRTFLQYFGLTVSQIAQMRLSDVVGQAIYESAQQVFSRALEGEAASFDRLISSATGGRRWMTIRLVPDTGAAGAVNGAFMLMHDIHGLKQAQEALRASESELRLIMDNVPARVSYIDRDYRYRFVNGHNEKWLGRARSELAGQTIAEVAGVQRFELLRPLLDRVLTGETVSTELELPQPDGGAKWEAIHYAPHRDAENNVIGIYAVHSDIDDQKQNEGALKRANWMLSSHIGNTPLAVLEWDRDLKLVRWSPQAQNIFGWAGNEVLGMPMTDNRLLHADHRGKVAGMIDRLLSGETPRETGMTKNHRSDGSTIWCEWYHSALLGEDGKLVSVLSFVQDVSSRIQAEDRLQYLATRDALTGLPNRVMLNDRLTQAIAQARRNGRSVGVMLIDLDRFKNVNDTLGHRIGDELLKLVTQVLHGALRESDLLARLGGDEFMVIVEDFDDPRVLGTIAQKLQDAIAQPFRIEDHDIYVASSIGIAVFPDDSDDPDTLMRHADVAMYRSKELGGNSYQFLDADLAERRSRQHTLETALRGALKEGALRLYYQPVVRISDRAIVGAEALLRWNDAEHGQVPPQVFIPLAEESGLIHSLGEWVLRTAAAQCAAWRRKGMALKISVNLSAKQFYREDLARRITDIVRGEGCNPSWLELEVTETSLMHDLDAIRKVLDELRGEGFTVAIDDFGTGYSSLTHLKHFPIDTLKIDISFIADLETDTGDAAITEAIIGLARGLGLKVVAEGVGTRAQFDFLNLRGCHCFQGYWVSQPLPADAFAEFVNKRPR